MGSLCGKGHGTGDEDSFATLVAEAAADGARKAVANAVDKAQQQKGKNPATEEPLVAGVLPLSVAQSAAATGAESGINEMARDLVKRLSFACDLNNLKVAAASAASAGVKAAVVMADHTDVEQRSVAVHREIAVAAAATGAWVACFFSLKTGLTPSPSTSRYTALLGPMLGGSFPTSVAMYNLVKSSSDFVKLCGFGGLTLGIFVVASGLVAGLFGKTARSACYTRIATVTAIAIVLVFLTIALCTMFQSKYYKGGCAVGGGLLILILVVVYFWLDWD